MAPPRALPLLLTLFGLAASLIPCPAAPQLWTAAADQSTLSANFVSLDGETLTLAPTPEIRLTFPLDTFIAADQARARELAATANRPPERPNILESLGAGLVKVENGQWVPATLPPAPRYILLYFSASWCPPCRAAAPDNVRKYQELIAPRPDATLVWISADRDPAAMLEWATDENFPWPTVPFDQAAEHPLQALAADFVPYYLLVNAEGETLAEGPEAAFAYLRDHPIEANQPEIAAEVEPEAQPKPEAQPSLESAAHSAPSA